VNEPPGPLLTLEVHEALLAARAARHAAIECSLDLGRTQTTVAISAEAWTSNDRPYPFLDACKGRTVYHWTGAGAGAGGGGGGGEFHPISRFTTSLIKLVPTQWGAPTFEIDGIKMLPTARISPYADAEQKVRLIEPRGKIILDTCGGLGYFAAHCLHGHAKHVHSFEKNPDVVWLRSLNPWSPDSPWNPAGTTALTLTVADIAGRITGLSSESFDAALHDPPRFGIAGELYSQAFYDQLARVLKRHGRLFHYTGAPNKVSRGRDLADEVAHRLQRAGFTTKLSGDGVLAVNARRAQ